MCLFCGEKFDKASEHRGVVVTGLPKEAKGPGKELQPFFVALGCVLLLTFITLIILGSYPS